MTAAVASTGAEELHVLTSTMLAGIASKVEVVSMELLLSLVLLWGGVHTLAWFLLSLACHWYCGGGDGSCHFGQCGCHF